MGNSDHPQLGHEIPCSELNALGYRIFVRVIEGQTSCVTVWWPLSQNPNWERAIERIVTAHTDAEILQQLLQEVIEVNQLDPHKAGLVEAAHRAMQRIIEEANHAE